MIEVKAKRGRKKLIVESWGGKTVERDVKWGLSGGFRSLLSRKDGGRKGL